MGYIMPIDNYQYQKYQERVTKEEKDPFPIEKLYPIPFQQQYHYKNTEEEFTRSNSTQADNNEMELLDKEKLTFVKEQNQQIYANITGKGKRFIAEA